MSKSDDDAHASATGAAERMKRLKAEIQEQTLRQVAPLADRIQFLVENRVCCYPPHLLHTPAQIDRTRLCTYCAITAHVADIAQLLREWGGR